MLDCLFNFGLAKLHFLTWKRRLESGNASFIHNFPDPITLNIRKRSMHQITFLNTTRADSKCLSRPGNGSVTSCTYLRHQSQNLMKKCTTEKWLEFTTSFAFLRSRQLYFVAEGGVTHSLTCKFFKSFFV